MGTGNEGKIYASKFLAKGTFTSGARPTAGGTKLIWDAHAPTGTTFSMSVRTAATKELLSSAEWREAGYHWSVIGGKTPAELVHYAASPAFALHQTADCPHVRPHLRLHGSRPTIAAS